VKRVQRAAAVAAQSLTGDRYSVVVAKGVPRSQGSVRPLGPLYGPKHRPTVGSKGKTVSYERGTPVTDAISKNKLGAHWCATKSGSRVEIFEKALPPPSNDERERESVCEREREQRLATCLSGNLHREGRVSGGSCAGSTRDKPGMPLRPLLFRGTSLIRTPPPLGPYSSPMPRDLW